MNRDEILGRLRGKIAGGIHRDALRTGDRLPSMRELATEWSVTPRLVRAAYESLEREGLVTLRPRSGVYITAPEGWADGVAGDSAWITDLFIHARARGIPPVRLADRLRDAMDRRLVRAVCAESNEDQVCWFVHEARADYGLDAVGLDLDAVDASELTRALKRADLVITTAFHGERLGSVAHALDRPVVLLRLSTEFVECVTRALRRGPLYFVVGDRRFAERLPMIYGGAGAENLRPVVACEDDLATIPQTAAVYVTRAAELRCPPSALRRTVRSPGRIFSDSMAAELLSLIVRANLAAALALDN